MTANNKARSLAAMDSHPDVLTDIYKEQINIAIWQRQLADQFQSAVNVIVDDFSTLQIVCTVGVDDCVSVLGKELGNTEAAFILVEDIHMLVDMYCCLFELQRVALRLTKLDRAMCPKFHVDRVPARLVTTYQGSGTQWLLNDSVDRSKLGAATAGIADDMSGLYQQATDVCQLSVGDVALLKGERWIGNEGQGIVHRSPSITSAEQRLLMTFDFTDG